MPLSHLSSSTERLPSVAQARYSLAAGQVKLSERVIFGLSIPLFLMIVVALIVSIFEPASRWVSLLANNASVFLLLLLSLHNAKRICQWRAEKFSPSPKAQKVPADEAQTLTVYQRLSELIPINFRRLDAIFSSDGVALGAMALFVLLIVRLGWGSEYSALWDGALRWSGVGIIAATIFTLLVAERHLSATSGEAWPEAKHLVPIVRLALAVQLLTLPVLLVAGDIFPLLVNLPAILVMLVAVEFLLRGLFSLFTPPAEEEDEPALLAQSKLAALLDWPPRPLHFLQRELHDHFGIDLRQIWAVAVLRRAMLPVIAAMLLCGWLLTGVQQIPATQRGIYERFGKPVAVLSSGLHYGLPWPFGQLRLTEYGQVHELAAGWEPGESGIDPLVSAEGDAPASANRLWDAVHSYDKAQIIASESGGQQGLQIVNSDVRFMWRIGLTKDAALEAAYQSASLPDLIRSVASQVLVHQFSSQTLDGLLGPQRNALASRINLAVQQKLDRLNSGVELLSTVVEAIHPPAGAADAFHSVQAAQIASQALISRERGHAAELAASAQTTAAARHDHAQIQAADVNGKARETAVRFAAQKQAVAQSGQVFVDELWFSQLHQALGHSPLLIIDNRIGADASPTVDLRDFPSFNDAARRDTPAEKTQELSR